MTEPPPRAPAERWQDDPTSSIGPRLAEIARYRQDLDRAEQVAAAPAAHRFEAAERARHVKGARRGLDAAVMMALGDRTPPPDADLLAAAGITPEHLADIRQRFRRNP